METAERVAQWTEARMDAVNPKTFALTFFGGEPLLNLPVMYFLAERLWKASEARGIEMMINVITNGLLLTPEVVDRLKVPIEREGFETIGGYLMSRLGRVPAVGEHVIEDGLDIEVLEAERRRVLKVRVRGLPAEGEA